jgi:hypothetical protein
MATDDLDHEVIDSPRALFRHLYEEHGVAEALDLDPATAPLQFWLRKHSDLERAARRSAADERLETSQHFEGVAPGEENGGEPGSAGDEPAGGPSDRPPSPPDGAAGPSPGRVSVGARSATPGPRFRPFTDPVVEAVASALVGRGMDEREVRRGLSTYAGAGGRHGEEAVRAAFISPMLDAIAAQLAGEPARRAQWPGPRPATTSDPARWRSARERGPSPPSRRTASRDPSPTSRPPGTPSPDAPAAPAASGAAPPESTRAAQSRAAPSPPTPSPAGRETKRFVPGGSAPREPVAGGAAAREPTPAWSGRAEQAPEGSAPREGAPWAAASDPDADFMAIADVLQKRRKPRRGGRKDAPARAARSDTDDEFMALADALQRRRGAGGRR